MSAEAKHNMVLTRVFDAPVERVWQAWGDAADVKRWWGPNGFTAPVATMNFREGGTSLVCMKAPPEYGDMELYNTWTYQKLVPNQRLEFIQHFTDAQGNPVSPASVGLPAEIPDEVPHVITFTSLGANKTEITIMEFGYPSAQIVETSKAGMEQCMDKMAAIFEA